jgi:hypothetical protein
LPLYPPTELEPLLPRFAAPEAVHALNAVRRCAVGLPPDGVPVHVHDREIEEQIDSAGFTSELDHVPIEMQSVRIEHAQGAIVEPVLDRRQQLTQIYVGVVVNDVDVAAALTLLLKIRGFAPVEVDEEEFRRRVA